MNNDLSSYYHQRANEYDKVYAIPAEQQDLAAATKILQPLFADKTVLEIACGTGYWTKVLAVVASSILATDINASVIAIAQAKNNAPNIQFHVADMYQLQTGTKYEALFGGFIWSHILLQQLDVFLQIITRLILPGGTIAFIDSKQVAGGVHDDSSIAVTDDNGNTYQKRKLEDGTEHTVLKNFPSKEILQQKLSAFCSAITYTDLEHYWIVTGKLK
ncbi:class I SAM-dependent methyltransferase [Ferruginibacter sp.]